MAEERNIMAAKEAFGTLCRTLEKNDWHYDKDEEDLTIHCGAQGEDLPMKITVNVDADKMLVILFSHLPFIVQEDKRLDAAVAVSVINNNLVDGSFDYDITDGHMFFRMTGSFLESTLSEEVFAYMLYCSCQTIDLYNDKLLMLAKGIMSIEQFLDAVTN